MKLIFLGPPGAGKGTIAHRVLDDLNVVQISTGDLLRAAVAAGSELGKKAKSFMDSGELVPDELVIDLLKERIAQDDCKGGFILDGFPRTIPQAEAMVSAGVEIDHVVEIAVDDDEIVSRLSGRRVHPGSGRVYHVEFNRPKQDGLDDVTGDPLVQRDDDTEETVRKRLKIYQEQTSPLIDFYQNMQGNSAPSYHRVEGVGSVEDIKKRLVESLPA